MYKERNTSGEDGKIPVTITIDKNLFENLQEFRKEHGLKTLSGRINDLLWDWLNNQIRKINTEPIPPIKFNKSGGAAIVDERQIKGGTTPKIK